MKDGEVTSYDVTIEPRATYTRVAVAGFPSIDQMLSLIHLLGIESTGWEAATLLVDLRDVGTVFTHEEQFRIGQETACSLAHMRKIASVVPTDRITRVSEKAARRNGTNVSVFDDEQKAVAWLRQETPRV